MILRHLTIRSFRNLAEVDLDLAPGVTLFHGANAQGKTNLLEAVHYLATGRSFRTRADRECLPWGAPAGGVARIEGRVEGRVARHEIAISLTERAKFAWLDGKPLARLGDLLGHLLVVLFTPDDIELASGGPALRRRFLDIALSQTSAAYLAALQGYSEALRQRNAALRSPDRWGALAAPEPALDPWAELLLEHGVTLALRRREAAAAIAEQAAALYASIAPDDGPLALRYRSGAGIAATAEAAEAREQFRRRLLETAETERLRGQTIIGPHRDDFGLTIQEREVRDYASQGQRRSVALALRLAELQWMALRTGERPVLLVDDLGSELDRDRRGRLLALFGAGAQTLATTAGDPERLGQMMGADRALEVRAGAVREQPPQ